MSSVFTCMAYSDVESTIRLADNVVYLCFKDKTDNVHLTLNPAQVLCFSDISIADITVDENFGDMTVEIAGDDYEEEMKVAVPF